MTRLGALAVLIGVFASGETRAQSDRGFSATFGIDVPLTAASKPNGDATQGEQSTSTPRVSLTLFYSPPQTHLFGRLGFYRYFDEEKKASWNPDFTYSFGYDDWHPGTFSLTYANYGGNRIKPDRSQGESVTHVEEGTITVAYKIPIPISFEAFFVPHPDNRLSAAVAAHLTPRYQQASSTERGDWKKSLSANFRYRFYRWWYAEASAHYYPEQGQQQPWDPDYTYGFGFFDWHPGTVSIRYSNFAANRFPGHDSSTGTSWRDGGLTIAWSHAW